MASRTCPGCQRTMDGDVRFCPYCGTPRDGMQQDEPLRDRGIFTATEMPLTGDGHAEHHVSASSRSHAIRPATPDADATQADSVRRAMEDKQILDSGFGCLGVVLLFVALCIGFLVGVKVDAWLGIVIAGGLFIGGMFWLAAKRYPR